MEIEAIKQKATGAVAFFMQETTSLRDPPANCNDWTNLAVSYLE
jgi:hypothetical protein